MKKILVILPLIAFVFTGCTALKNFTKDNPPTNTHATCAKMKRDIIFYRNDPNMNIGWNSPTKRAALMQRYSRMNCDKLLKESKHVAASKQPTAFPI